MPLPPGFAINPTTGVIAGQTTVPGTYRFTARATDAGNRVAIRSDTIVIFDNPSIDLTLPDGVNGVPYTGQVTGSNGSSPYAYSLTTGPAWMSVHPTTGAITGTPNAIGTAISVIILVEGDIGGSAQISDTMNVT